MESDYFGNPCGCAFVLGCLLLALILARVQFLSSFFHYIFRMRRFAYCKVVLATSLVWVMLDMFILLYFSECNKCDDKKERGLPGRDGGCLYPNVHQ